MFNRATLTAGSVVAKSLNKGIAPMVAKAAYRLERHNCQF